MHAEASSASRIQRRTEERFGLHMLWVVDIAVVLLILIRTTAVVVVVELKSKRSCGEIFIVALVLLYLVYFHSSSNVRPSAAAVH